MREKEKNIERDRTNGRRKWEKMRERKEKRKERAHMDKNLWYIENLRISNIIVIITSYCEYNVAPLLIKYIFM